MGKTRALRKYRRKSKQVKTLSKSFSKKSRKRASKQKKNKRTVKRRLGVKNRRSRRIMRGGALKEDGLPKTEEEYKESITMGFGFNNEPVVGIMKKTRFKLRGKVGRGMGWSEWAPDGSEKERLYMIEFNNGIPLLKYFIPEPKGVIPLKNAFLEDKIIKGEKHVYLEYLEDGKNERRPAGTRGRVKLVFDSGNGLRWLNTYIEDAKTVKIKALEKERERIYQNIADFENRQFGVDPSVLGLGRIKEIHEEIEKLNPILPQEDE